MKKILLSSVFTATFALLAACGGDSSSGSDESQTSTGEDAIVETVNDLLNCTEMREGATAYVKSEKMAYVCKDGDWVPDTAEESSDSDEDLSSSSQSGAAASSSGAEPVSSADETSSSSVEPESSAAGDTTIVPIKDISISGFSQKGPFVMNSSVTANELQDGKTLKQTGKNFTGTIKSNDGLFDIKSVTLASQYAYIVANGCYRNEVTGENSKSPITLQALTDLTLRKTANVNLLTHLEYDRVVELVTKSGMSVRKAKAQAESELMKAFYVDMSLQSNFEDLNIFSAGDDNAALLAISIMMQGDLGEADFSERLASFARDIESDGKWDDEKTKAAIADWVGATDLNGGLETIKTNIDGWNLGTAPDFEKYVRNFWYVNYGLGDCGSGREGEVAADSNANSANYYENTLVRFICKSGAWVEATDLEKDTYKWEAGKDGEIKLGDITQSKYYDYDGAEKAWRAASAVERMLGGCTETREADISLNTGKVNGTWYICRSREWESTNNITVDTQGWVEGSDGDLKKGDSTDVMYKYDEALDQWVETNTNDVNLKLMGCTTNRTDEIGQSGETYYVCKNSYWQEAEEIDYETYGEKCTSADVGKTMNGKVTESNKYYCSASGWVSLMGWSWDVPKEARFNPGIKYDTLADERDGKKYRTVEICNAGKSSCQTWMAENLNYADSVKTPSLKGKTWCYGNVAENCEVAGRLYTWAAAIDSVALANDADNPQTCGYEKTCTLPTVVQGVCPEGWHLPSQSEWQTLFENVGGSGTAGTALKTATGWYSQTGDVADRDAYGFAVFPAGYRGSGGYFFNAGDYAAFWLSTEYYGNSAYYEYFYYNYTYVYEYRHNKGNALSVRCLRD